MLISKIGGLVSKLFLIKAFWSMVSPFSLSTPTNCFLAGSN